MTAAWSSPVVKVELFAVRSRFRHAFALGSGHVDGSTADPDVLFVRLETADGSVGWGEQRALPSWSYETLATMASVITEVLGPLVTDLDRLDPALFHQRADAALRPAVSQGFPFARAAVDLALHDLVGRRLGVPVHALLGGRVHDRIPLCSAIGIDTPEAMAERARESAHLHAYKIKIGGDPIADAQRVRAVAEVAAGKPLWLDANQSYRPSTLRVLLDRIADVGPLHCVEQPVPSTDWAGLRRARELTGPPIAIDEGCFSATDLARTAVLDGADLVVIKVGKSGGLHPALRSAAVAEAHGIEVLASGLTDLGVGFAAALHFFAGQRLSLPAELNGPELVSQLYVDGLEFVDGAVSVPTGPGLGIAVDEGAIRADTVR